jgi:hypothetical protein
MKTSDTDARKILLIGDIDRAFLDADAVSELPCEVRTNMRDGVNAAAKNSFVAIAVVMSGLSANCCCDVRLVSQIKVHSGGIKGGKLRC